jgi:hypothetical protein
MRRMRTILSHVAISLASIYLGSFLVTVALLPREEQGRVNLVELIQVISRDGDTAWLRTTGYDMWPPYGGVYAPVLQLIRLPIVSHLFNEYYYFTHGDLVPRLETDLNGEKSFGM